jgi:Escherichia/Staphylococcus phage prohead protease
VSEDTDMRSFDQVYRELSGEWLPGAAERARARREAAAIKSITADMEAMLLAEKVRDETKRLQEWLLFQQFGDQLRALQRASERSTTSGRASLAGVAAEAKAAASAAARTGQRVEHKAVTWAVDAPAPTITASGASSGTFEGYLAVFGTEDMVWANPATNGDIIEPGAFTKTLADAKARRLAKGGRYLWPIFWAHDDKDPIGGFTDAAEDTYGLFVRGELDLDIDQGKRAYSGLKKGYCDGMSIGFFTIRATYDGQGRRHLKELSVFEGSLTAIPMHPDALATSSN